MTKWDADDNHGPSESGRYCLCGRFWPCRVPALLDALAASQDRERTMREALDEMVQATEIHKRNGRHVCTICPARTSARAAISSAAGVGAKES